MLKNKKNSFVTLKFFLATVLTIFFFTVTSLPSHAYTGVATASKSTACHPNTVWHEDYFSIEFTQTVHLEATLFIPPNTSHCGMIPGRNFVIDDLSTPGLDDKTWNIGSSSFFNQDVVLNPGNYQLKSTLAMVCPGNYSVSYWSGPKNPSASVSPASYSFGTKTAGSTSSESFTVENNGNVPIVVNSIVSDNASVFSVTTSTSLPHSMDPDDTMDFSVTFSAPNVDDTHSARINISWQGDGTPGTTQATVSGTSEVPKPEICCANSLACGTANWYTSEYKDSSLSVQNCGEATLQIFSANITGSDASYFTVTSFPSSIPSGDTRSINIRFRPTEERTYNATLTISSNSDNDPNKTVSLSGIGHRPVPRIQIDSLDLDYRKVELGFTFHRILVVRNVGDAQLEFDVNFQDPNDPDLSEFTVTTGADYRIDGGEKVKLVQSFTPTTPGEREVKLIVENTNDDLFGSATVRLHGEGINPAPLYSALVLDRSGSMAETSGRYTKIEGLRMAANLYIDLLRQNVDYLGLTKYNHNYQNILSMGLIDDPSVTNSHTAGAKSKVDDINNINGLKPSGTTCIGGAMTEASQQFASVDPTQKRAMIVLTDGKENASPYIADALVTIDANYPGLPKYSIGLGTATNINSQRLEDIADSGTDGTFLFTGDLTDEAIYKLENFYFKIFSRAVGDVMIVDPILHVAATSVPQIIAEANIVSSDRHATFLIIGAETGNKYFIYKLELISPGGQIITPTSTIGGISVLVRKAYNYTIYRVNFPPVTQWSDHIGTWKLRLVPEPREEMAEEARSPLTTAAVAAVPGTLISFAASAGSNYKMHASVTPSRIGLNEIAQLKASLEESALPSPYGIIHVDITRPDGSTITDIPLHDDGSHDDGANNDAIWGNSFAQTNLKGVYRFLFKANGKTERGEDVRREEAIFKYIGPPEPERPPVDEKECIPCWLLRLIIIITIVLLLFIIYLLLFRRRFAVDN